MAAPDSGPSPDLDHADRAKQGAARSTQAEQARPLLPWLRYPGRELYRIAFVGAEPAIVSVAADSFNSIELYVFDLRGELICKSVSAAITHRCRWLPERTAEYVIEVRSQGPRPSPYSIWTN